jgi:3-dehydroquinate dehydratase-1
VPARGIYLIGFSGTGKSTIAHAVAAALGWPVYDLDRVIAERSGTTIPLIFEREGEAAFREREAEALRAVSGSAPFVVATGGGAPMRDENRRLMASTGWVIALEGRPEALHERIQRQLRRSSPDAARPLLGAADPLDAIRALKQRRQSVYALADWTVHTDRLTPEQVAAEVVRAVRLLEATPEPPASFAAPAEPSPDRREPAPPAAAGVTRKRIEVRGRPVGGGKLPLVCTPLVGGTREALVEEASAVAARGPDVVEWRVDFFERIARAEEVVDAARAVKAALAGGGAEVPLLFTRRSPREGGRPVPISEPEVLGLYEAVCASGSVDLVDYELCNAAEDVRRVREASRSGGVKLVLSYHDFERTPPAAALRRKFLDAERMGADAAKVAVMPRSLHDVLALLSATLQADEELRIPLISVSMGPHGSLTRMCGWMFGSTLTFAIGKGSSAPGQVPIEDLRAVIELLRRSLGEPAG